MNWNSQIRNSFQEHMPLYLFVAVLFLMGIVFGVFMVNALSLEQKQDLSAYLGTFFQSLDQPDFDAKQSFQHAFGLHLKWMLLIFLFGLSVIGLPLVLILNFLKGVLIGFTIGYLVGQFSWKGMMFALVTVAPQNLVLIPTFLIASVAALSFSIFIINSRVLDRKGNVGPVFWRYSLTSLTMVGLCMFVAAFEAFVSPNLIDWASPWLHS